MSIKQTYGNVEEIPEGLESIYSQTDSGSYQFVGADGLVDKGRVDEFRDNNIQLRKDLESRDDQIGKYSDQLTEMIGAVEKMESKYGNVDLEEWNTYQAERKMVAEKELIEAGDVDLLINGRVEEVIAAKQKEIEALKETYEKQLDTMKLDITGYDTQLNKMLVDNELTKIAADKGVRSSALEDVLSRGRTVFRVEDGRAAAFSEEGRQIYMEDAVTPLTIDGWIEGLTKTAPHLFEMSSGSGIQQPTSSPAPVAEPQSPEQLILAGLGNL